MRINKAWKSIKFKKGLFWSEQEVVDDLGV